MLYKPFFHNIEYRVSIYFDTCHGSLIHSSIPCQWNFYGNISSISLLLTGAFSLRFEYRYRTKRPLTRQASSLFVMMASVYCLNISTHPRVFKKSLNHKIITLTLTKNSQFSNRKNNACFDMLDFIFPYVIINPYKSLFYISI